MEKVCCIVLAAGAGKRMKSDKPKVLSEVLFKPMISWVTDSISTVGIKDICVVSGFKRDLLKTYLCDTGLQYVEAVQEEQLGTAHAVMCAKDFLLAHQDCDVIVLNGDAPFMDTHTIKQALYDHRKHSAVATVITSEVDDPFGYGRIIRDTETGFLKAIVEHKDADSEQLQIKEINSGAYWFNASALLSALDKVTNNNAQGEFYLPDTLEILLKQEQTVRAFLAENSDVVLGANNITQLAYLNELARNRILDRLAEHGVFIPCRDGVMISPDAVIGEQCTVLPSTLIRGKTTVKKGCTLGANSVIINCNVGENVVLSNVYAENHTFEDNMKVEPFTQF